MPILNRCFLLSAACLVIVACNDAQAATARMGEPVEKRPDRTHARAETPTPAEKGNNQPEATTASNPASPNGFPEIKPTPFFRTVPKGEARAIGFFSYVFPDCTPQGLIVARLTSQPQHGTVTFEEAESFPRYALTSPVVSCNSKKTPGLKMTYATRDDYEGPDTFGVLLINPDGTVTALDVKVMIR